MKQDVEYIKGLQNPYKGLFQYTANDEILFFGRDRETNDLVEMIKNNQLVVIYGDSGTGKTSLIKAKLFPELSRQYYFPIYIRFNYLGKTDPITQLRETIHKELRNWDQQTPPFTPNLTLIEYAAQTSILNGLVKPILFFDQFEELFTLGQKYVEPKVLNNLIQQVSDLVEMRLPERKNIRELMPAGSEAEESSFEETCTENALRFTAVISMRQDYLAQLDDLRFQIPSISSNRYRLKRFDNVQAQEAIVKPAGVFSNFKIPEGNETIVDNEAASIMVHQLKKLDFVRFRQETAAENKSKNIFKQFLSLFTDIAKKIKEKKERDDADISSIFFRNTEIDPTVLSLYCNQLYKEGELTDSGLRRISTEQAHRSPADKIIKNYYTESLRKKRIKREIEDCLITPDGRRVLVPLTDFLQKARTAEKKVIDLIKQTGILRIYGEGDEREIELAHDQIAKQAMISKRQRETNSVKRNLVIFFLTGVTIVVLTTLLTANFIQSQKSKYVVTDLQNRNSQLNSEKEKLQGDLQNLETEYNALKDVSQIGSDSLRTVLLSKITELDKSRYTVTYLQNENATLKAEYNDQSGSLKAYINLAEQRSSDLSRAQNRIDVLQRQSGLQADSLKSYSSRITKLTADLNKQTSDNSKLVSENSGLSKQVTFWNNRYKNSQDSLKMYQRLYRQLLQQQPQKQQPQRQQKQTN